MGALYDGPGERRNIRGRWGGSGGQLVEECQPRRVRKLIFFSLLYVDYKYLNYMGVMFTKHTMTFTYIYIASPHASSGGGEGGVAMMGGGRR